MILLLLACTASPSKGTDTSTETGTDTSTETGTDTADDSGDDTGAVWAMDLPAFEPSDGHGRADECDLWMPVAYECTGPNPPVTWTAPPAGADALVLILDDPDANDFAHWAVYGIPPTESGLAEAISGQDVAADLPPGATELDNGFRYAGSGGSCPPAVHLYRWRIWAVTEDFSFTPSGSATQQFHDLADAAEAASLGSAGRCHLYGPE
jgi:phosphatidylethanolamine-binding protein (PEBP) family uncharacterized protein